MPDTPSKLPSPIAVIDVGSHSVKMEIVQFTESGKLHTLETLSHPVPIGRDVFMQGDISAENINLIGRIFKDFSAKMAEYGIYCHKATATSAVREADNREIFINRIEILSGIKIEVLEASEEIRIMYLSIKNALSGKYSLKGKNAVICIIGTGSTHVCSVRNGHLKSSESLRIGTLRLFEEIGQPMSFKKSKDIIDAFVSNAIDSIIKIHFGDRKPELFIAAGAAVRILAELGQSAPNLSVTTISGVKIRSLFPMIEATTPDQLAQRFKISDLNAQSLEPCCNILKHFLKLTNAEKLIIPMINTRDALIEEIIRHLSNERDPFIEEIISCAEFIGEKYRYDLPHVRCVTDAALRIFDNIRELHGIGEKGRMLLEVASILHDTGQFINNRQHHKHSYYLIKNSQIPGISPEELNVVAAIARYHRRGIPKTSHPEYMSLLPEERVMVSKLAAILRIADSLDRSHTQRMKNFKLNYDDSTLYIHAKGSFDLTMEQLEVKRRMDLFQDVFGRKVIVEV